MISDDVRELHQASGLTWRQLGRMLGVSGQVVYGWSTGTRIQQQSAERVRELHRIVRGLPYGTPEECLRALLRSEAGEPSVVERFYQESQARVAVP